MQEQRRNFTHIDLFAGAGGFSEGFLQAGDQQAGYEFLLASDINENCELTHLARYNHQLGLDAKFLRKDIRGDGFIDELVDMIGGREVDVVTGGPPCQSFSLAGKRRAHDHKDDLFAGYLRVIARLRPKYFVMENVPGLLTKQGGAFRRQILDAIRSIVDPDRRAEVLTTGGAVARDLSGRDARLAGVRSHQPAYQRRGGRRLAREARAWRSSGAACRASLERRRRGPYLRDQGSF